MHLGLSLSLTRQGGGTILLAARIVGTDLIVTANPTISARLSGDNVEVRANG